MDGEIVATTSELREICSDLLSLRAAVRRVLEADKTFEASGRASGICALESVLDSGREWRHAIAALRAEMASLDGDGNGGAS